MSPRSVTVSIISHGHAALLKPLLDDLKSHAGKCVAEVVITMNVPECLELHSAENWPVIVHRNATPQGFGANHNTAFTKCRTPFFAVLNPDLRFEQDPFGPLLEQMRDTSVGVSAPVVLEPNGQVANSARRLYTPIEIVLDWLRVPVPVPAPDWVAGMFMLFRSDAFRAVGGFDERFFLYGEDFDICARLRLAGWSISQVGRSQVVHHAQRASHRSLRHLIWHVASTLRIWRSDAFWRYRALLRRRGSARSKQRR